MSFPTLIHRAAVALVIALLVLAALVMRLHKKEAPPEQDWYASYEQMVWEEQLVTEFRQSAYEDAIKCTDVFSPKLKFADITWVVLPSSAMKFQAIEGTVKLKGYFSVTDSTIYVPYNERFTRWVNVHESMHAIGYIGHPNNPFRWPCYVMPDQHTR